MRSLAMLNADAKTFKTLTLTLFSSMVALALSFYAGATQLNLVTVTVALTFLSVVTSASLYGWTKIRIAIARHFEQADKRNSDAPMYG